MIKKLIYIIIIIIFFLNNSVFAEQKDASVQYNGCQYAFKKGDEVKFLKNADKNIKLFENAQNKTDKDFYLQESMRYYFLLSQVQPKSIEAQIGLGRVYDEMKRDRFAKKYFFNAINMDAKNPKANLYFADFYYKRNELVSAVYYYKQAYTYGFADDYNLNCKLGTICEKLADIEYSKRFYAKAFKLNPSSQELTERIQRLDSLNYSQSQYYIFSSPKK